MFGVFFPCSVLIKRAAISLLALLLLLTPICSQFCRAQACETPHSGHRHSPCHPSTSPMMDASVANFALSSTHNCLQSPSAWLRPQSIPGANFGPSLSAGAVVNAKLAEPDFGSALSLSSRHSPPELLASSLLVLRI